MTFMLLCLPDAHKYMASQLTSIGAPVENQTEADELLSLEQFEEVCLRLNVDLYAVGKDRQPNEAAKEAFRRLIRMTTGKHHGSVTLPKAKWLAKYGVFQKDVMPECRPIR